LLKDVDGVYECDPALQTNMSPRRFVALGYAEAPQRANQLIQPKAVRFLERMQRTQK
jgi:uridylate kinase